MVPKQASSGGKTTLLGISKRGDSYLRTLFIHGARAVVQQAERHPERADPWLKQLLAPPTQECRGGGAGEQERAHRLGAAGARARLSTAARVHERLMGARGDHGE